MQKSDMSDKFDNCFKLYEKAIEGRNFHYSNYNTWINYYSIFTGTLFVCYYNCYKGNGFGFSLYSSIFMLLVSLLGMITAICWHSTVKGHYWWMLSWINIVQKYEGELNSCSEDIFDYWVYNAYKASPKNFDQKNISSQKLTSAFTFIVSLAWGIILSYHTYLFILCLQRKLGNINDFCMKVFIFIISVLLVIVAFIFLLILFSRGLDISSMKPDIKEGKKNINFDEILIQKLNKFYETNYKGRKQSHNITNNERWFHIQTGNYFKNYFHIEYINLNGTQNLQFHIEFTPLEKSKIFRDLLFNLNPDIKNILTEKNMAEYNSNSSYLWFDIKNTENITTKEELFAEFSKYLEIFDSAINKIEKIEDFVKEQEPKLKNLGFEKDANNENKILMDKNLSFDKEKQFFGAYLIKDDNKIYLGYNGKYNCLCFSFYLSNDEEKILSELKKEEVSFLIEYENTDKKFWCIIPFCFFESTNVNININNSQVYIAQNITEKENSKSNVINAIEKLFEIIKNIFML